MSAKELSERLEVAQKTIYADFEALKELGYALDKDHRNRWCLIPTADRRQITFVQEEMVFLDELLSGQSHALAKSIRNRLFGGEGETTLDHAPNEVRSAEVIHRLKRAMDTGKQAVLIGYRSASSSTLSDRVVSPIDFLPDYHAVRAIEAEGTRPKVFKISRIAEVKVLDAFSVDKPSLPPPDAFGMCNDHTFLVRLRMKPLAAYLLEEEFPVAGLKVQPTGEPEYPYEASLQVCNEAGIGRFVMGLIDAVAVVEGESVAKWVEERIAGGLKQN